MRPTLRIPRTLVAAVALAVTGCASSVNLSSSPPDVMVLNAGKEVGKTPLTLDVGKLKEDASGGYLLEFRRDDYKKVWLWFPKGVSGTTLNVNLQPFMLGEGETRVVTRKKPKAALDRKSADLLRAQTLILTDPGMNEADVRALVARHKDVTAAAFLEAALDLRANKKEEALPKLKAAIGAAPAEPDYLALYRDLGGVPETGDEEAAAPANPAAAPAPANAAKPQEAPSP